MATNIVGIDGLRIDRSERSVCYGLSGKTGVLSAPWKCFLCSVANISLSVLQVSISELWMTAEYIMKGSSETTPVTHYQTEVELHSIIILVDHHAVQTIVAYTLNLHALFFW
eukprot:TRINITY_DN20278_c0_g1_i4.p1 TRINITY_DN20278_c0_g1~~TRINITY_DN20278_c0_g1_i4.p1  ORF type:complete len:112 (+),score=11.75 TRINITY_DN20278_c0_g1_i4:96-431(+)